MERKSEESARKKMGRRFSIIRELAAYFDWLSFYPQWLTRNHRRHITSTIEPYLKDIALDIGYGDHFIKKLVMRRKAQYIGVDYPLAMTKGYTSRPNVFANAQALPFKVGVLQKHFK